MSLLFWITGNNGLTNQGISDILWEPDHVINEHGKTGSCIQFSSTENAWTDALTFTSNLKSFAISFWHKIPGSTNSVGILNITPVSGPTITIAQEDASFTTTMFPTENPDSYNGVFGEWKHMIYEYDADTKTHTLYINGFGAIKDVGEIDDVSQVKFGAGEFCDIRIYDSTVSSRQIMDIASGLIAKYPLGNPTQIQKFGLTDSSGFGHTAMPGIESKPLSWSDRAVVGYGSFSPSNNYLNCGHIAFDSNTISISIWVYFDSWKNTTDNIYGILSFTNAETSFVIDKGDLYANISVNRESGTAKYSCDAPIDDLKKGWHMISANFVVYPGDFVQISLFIDGKFANTTSHEDPEVTSIYNPDESELIIGGIDGIPMSRGLLADCRVYAAAVYNYSKRYESRVEVDNEGNLYGYGLTGSNDGNNKMTSEGLIGGEITEGGDKFKAFNKHFSIKEYHDI